MVEAALARIGAEQRTSSRAFAVMPWVTLAWRREAAKGRQELKAKEVTPVIVCPCQQSDSLVCFLAASLTLNL